MEENEEKESQSTAINIAMSPIEMTEDGILNRDMLISIPEEFIGSPDKVTIIVEIKGYHLLLSSLLYSMTNFQNSDTVIIAYEK